MKATPRRGRVFIGTSGYVYAHWAGGEFYPQGLPRSKWLSFYAQSFTTVELNGTFYRLPSARAFENWHAQTPRDFLFFVKGSRFVTHFKRLKDPYPALERFFSAASPLKEKLAGVLWQLPGRYQANQANIKRVAEFLAVFRQFSQTRLAMEFRHPSWFVPEITAALARHNAVYCRADAPAFYLEMDLPHTAAYAYYRRHGAGAPALHGGNYPDAALEKDAAEIRRLLRKGMDVFCYFNNDIGGHAIRNAHTLQRLLGPVKK